MHRPLFSLMFAVSLGCAAGSASDPASEDDSTADAISSRAKNVLSCDAVDSCDAESDLGYCVQSIRVRKSSSATSIRFGRYSSIIDRDLTDYRSTFTSFRTGARSIDAAWPGGSLSVRYNRTSKVFAGTLVVDGKSLDVQCTADDIDPCVRSSTAGTYCGENLVHDSARASTLYSCADGRTTTTRVCRGGCGDFLDLGQDGVDRCQEDAP